MGNRVRVTLSVLKKHLDKVVDLDNTSDAIKDVIIDGVDVSVLCFEAVSQGRLSFESTLVAENIPYSLSWAGGDEIEAGSCVHHQVEGKWITHTFYERERDVICLKALIDANVAGVQAKFIENETKRQSQFTVDWSLQD